jgi:hypothetical protein
MTDTNGFTRHNESLPPAVAQLADELRALDTLPADDRVLARIARSRAEGARVLLPTTEMPTTGTPASGWAASASAATSAYTGGITRWRWSMLAAGVAATGAVALWGPDAESGAPGAEARGTAAAAIATERATVPAAAASRARDSASPTANPARELAGLLTPWPVMAQAQRPGTPPSVPFPPITQVDPSRLAPGRRSYVRLSANAYHELVPHQTYDISVDSARQGGRRLWRVVVEQPLARALEAPPQVGRLVDTLWLDGATLRPRQRRYEAGVLNVRQSFSDTALVETDSIDAGRLGPTSRGSRVPFRFGTTKRLVSSHIFVPSEAALRVLLRALRLAPGWRGSIGVLSGGSRMFAIGQPTLLNLRVAGVDTVQTFSGRFACWRVLLETGAEPEVWLVSQETGETILTDGPYDSTYPRSRSYLVSGFEETRRIPAVRLRP